MLRKKTFYLLFLILFLFSFSLCSNAVDISASSAIVVNADTFEVVYEKSAHEKRSMASTTKIMTSLLAIESGKLDETVTVNEKMSGIEGTSIGLKVGYKIKLRDLVYSMLLESGNDAAVATAVYLSGSEQAFSEKMNEKAKSIGMTATNFVTASGLDDEAHYTCAYDMAMLAIAAINNPVFCEICSQKQYTFDYVSPEMRYTLSNHNRLLRTVEGVFGIKTGFTKKSGRCLVTAIERNGFTFVVVTLNAPNDWNDHKKLFDYAFDNTQTETVSPELPEYISVQGGLTNKLFIESIGFDVAVLNKNSELTSKTYLPQFVYAPIKKGDILGKCEIYYEERLIKTFDITASADIDSIEETYIAKKSLIEKIKEILFKNR